MKSKDAKAADLANHILHNVLDIDRIWNGMKQGDKTPGRTKKYEHLKKKYGKNLAEYATKLEAKGDILVDDTHYYDPRELLEVSEIKMADQGKQTKVIKLYCKKLLAQYVQDVRAMTKDISSGDGDSWTFYPIFRYSPAIHAKIWRVTTAVKENWQLWRLGRIVRRTEISEKSVVKKGEPELNGSWKGERILYRPGGKSYWMSLMLWLVSTVMPEKTFKERVSEFYLSRVSASFYAHKNFKKFKSKD